MTKSFRQDCLKIFNSNRMLNNRCYSICSFITENAWCLHLTLSKFIVSMYFGMCAGLWVCLWVCVRLGVFFGWTITNNSRKFWLTLTKMYTTYVLSLSTDHMNFQGQKSRPGSQCKKSNEEMATSRPLIDSFFTAYMDKLLQIVPEKVYVWCSCSYHWWRHGVTSESAVYIPL